VVNLSVTDEQWRNDMSDNVYTYIKSNVEPFLFYPPDTDFERGYLAALLNVAEEALGLHLGKSPFMEAQKLCSTARTMNWLQWEISHRKRDVEDLKREF
jgi:hypothetical protein